MEVLICVNSVFFFMCTFDKFLVCFSIRLFLLILIMSGEYEWRFWNRIDLGFCFSFLI